MYRILFFLAIIVVPVIFGWWFFIPAALLFSYFARSPYEIIIAGLVLDLVYYFGDGFMARHPLALFSLLLVASVLFLDSRIHWHKII